MGLLRGGMEGRATFLVEGEPRQPEATEIGLPSLAAQVDLTNGLSGQMHNLPRLAQCYLANDRDQARNMAEAHPEAYFLLADGESYHGRMLTGGRKQSSGPLVLKRELREYAEQLGVKESEMMSPHRGARRSGSAKWRRFRPNSNVCVSFSRRARRKRFRSITTCAATSEEIHRSNSRVSVARLELERLKREEERTHETRARNIALAEQKEAERAERELALESLREQLEGAQGDAQRTSEEHAAQRANAGGRGRAASRRAQRSGPSGSAIRAGFEPPQVARCRTCSAGAKIAPAS